MESLNGTANEQLKSVQGSTWLLRGLAQITEGDVERSFGIDDILDREHIAD